MEKQKKTKTLLLTSRYLVGEGPLILIEALPLSDEAAAAKWDRDVNIALSYLHKHKATGKRVYLDKAFYLLLNLKYS